MKWIGFSALLFASMLFVGCGKSGSSGGSSAGSSAEADSGPVVRLNGVAIVTITGNDQMKYDVTQFTVHPGEKVRVIFENVGKQPVTTMGHDFVLLKQGQDYKEFANEVLKADNAQDKGELPGALVDKTIAHTKILGPGEKQTVEFTAPAAGTYEYLCTFPGHYVFMHGEMIVK